MPRHLPLALLIVAVALPAAAEPQTKRRPPPRNEYGFLPGYRPPEVVDRQERFLYSLRYPTYWYGWPRFYRGRWNGGGFGPCWTQTPIGNVWNCGR
jgi:hypothetical protein